MKTILTKTQNPYPIYIENGLLAQLPELTAQINPSCKLAVITDDTVASLYAQSLCDSLKAAGRDVCLYAFPHGEASKNLGTVQKVYSFLSENEITRSDMVIAVGGGVAGDLAGFAAATWLRGIPFIQVPTTFLAMVDSSVGGKTGVDLPEGKNLVGAFWQPRMVVCDPSTLNTLPAETLSDGVAEAIKTGAILDLELFEILEQGQLKQHLTHVIARCVELKRDVVEQDERDKGIRQWLNFGHTLGHAIEKASGYTLAHGKAVAIGMVMMAKACEQKGLTPEGTAKRIAGCCARYHLPTQTSYDPQTLCQYCLGDKKRAGSTISLVILEKLGKAALYPVQAENLLAFLKGENQ
ncbi:MAG: 3-dehydroquinate synthase [Oscillospiraceae bacterium]|nr:3-dehydroquinate synthase [Oscillospiraceae bacterium]